MKKFIIKSVLFLCIVMGVITFVLVTYGGYVDYFYEKFTTPKSHSLILGDSRSLQGIQPKIIDDYFKGSNLELPMFNYSFTLKQIAYGEPYFESIKRKIDTTTKKGLFIITVHPFTLSSRNKNNEEEEEGVFFETNMPPHNMEYVNNNPNYEYLLRNFDYFHFRGIFRKSSKTHKDGWLEETNLTNDTLILKRWKYNQIELYAGFSEKWKKSKTRINYLDSLVTFLNNYGKVVLVRLPIDGEILNIENEYWPDFNFDMQDLSELNNISYINFNTVENKFRTYDGIHIDKFSGVEFTNTLCDSINDYIKHSGITTKLRKKTIIKK